MKQIKRICVPLLIIVMLIGIIPIKAKAAQNMVVYEENTVEARAVKFAKSFISKTAENEDSLNSWNYSTHIQSCLTLYNLYDNPNGFIIIFKYKWD